MKIAIIPYLAKQALRKLYENPNTHEIVKKNIIQYSMKKRGIRASEE